MYLFLSVLYTYPQVLHMTTGCVEPFIGGSNDQYLHMWDAWWVKRALIDLGTSPFHTDLLNYPAGASLALQEIGVLNGLLTSPFQIIFAHPSGLLLGYNVAIILSFLISALGAYALVYKVVGNRAAAFLAGIGFAFMPYRSIYITTLNLLSTGWIPLYILFFWRTIQCSGWRNPLWSAVFFACALHSSNMHAFFLMLFSAVFALAWCITHRRAAFKKEVLGRVAVTAGLCFLVFLPNLLMIRFAGVSWEQPTWQSDMFSANVAGFFFPSDQQIVYNFLFSLMPRFDYYISGVPGHATFVSYTLLFLFVCGFLKSDTKKVLPWIITCGCFYVLSLGSKLHVWSLETDLRLPYHFLVEYLPFMAAMRTPFRFVVLERIALIVVASYGLARLLDSPEKVSDSGGWRSILRRRTVLPSIFGILLMAELAHVPFRYVEADIPNVYFEIAQEEEEFAVVDLPVQRYRDLAKYMFYQTAHKKPIPIGILNRPEAGLEDTTGRITSMLREAGSSADPQLLEELRRYGAGYLILHDFQEGKDRVLVYDLR